MYVQIDLTASPPVVTLEEPDDTNSFQVTVVGGDSLGLVFGALVDAAAGRLEVDEAQGVTAWIAVDSVRRMAQDRVGPDWDARLDAMLAYAKSKGWLDETGSAIRAHLEFA